MCLYQLNIVFFTREWKNDMTVIDDEGHVEPCGARIYFGFRSTVKESHELRVQI